MRQYRRFDPSLFRRELSIEQLKVQRVVKFGRGVHFAIVNVHRREKQLLSIVARERKCHGMNVVLPWLELENSEPPINVLREFVPGCFWKAESLVKPPEIFDTWDEGSLKIANVMYD